MSSAPASLALTRALESTAELLMRIRMGDPGARDRLIRRYFVRLRRWAHGRLPARARGLVDTEDLVQSSFLSALHHLESFEPHREGAFLAYLRKVLLNQIRDEIRRARRSPEAATGAETVESDHPSAIEEAIGAETLRRYEAALSTLPEEQRVAVILRVELGFQYRMIAETLELRSANAARMMIQRALLKIAPLMRDRDGS